MENSKTVKFGIIGTGRIAQQFLEEAKKIKTIEVIGISARNFEKTKEVAKKYDIKIPYENSTEMLANKEIEAVYIATMHPTHFPYTIKCLNAGKHVLCEKPSVLKSSELKEVIALAKSKKLLFMEAMIVGFNPIFKEIKSRIESNEIGEVVHLESSFGSKSTKVHKHNTKQAGGALFDIGIYNIFLSTYILGKPEKMKVISRSNKWGVEGSVTGLFEYKDGVTSTFYATMDSISGNSAKIIGTDGMIEIPDSWSVAREFKLKKLGAEDEVIRVEEDRWLGYEIEDFIKTILEGKIENEIMTYDKTLQLHGVIDEVKKELGFKYEDLEVEIY